MLPCLTPRRVGRPTTVFVEITLSGQADEVLDAFEREVALIPDVLECHLMAGTADYILKVVAEDTEDFARIHRRHLARLPGVAQMQSSFALKNRVQDDSAAGVASPDNRSHGWRARQRLYSYDHNSFRSSHGTSISRIQPFSFCLQALHRAHDKRFPSMWVDDLLIHAPVLKATPEGAPVAAGLYGDREYR